MTTTFGSTTIEAACETGLELTMANGVTFHRAGCKFGRCRGRYYRPVTVLSAGEVTASVKRLRTLQE